MSDFLWGTGILAKSMLFHLNLMGQTQHRKHLINKSIAGLSRSNAHSDSVGLVVHFVSL